MARWQVADPKQGRLIVRNLSFKVNLRSLQQAFNPYGKIEEAKIPTKACPVRVRFRVRIRPAFPPRASCLETICA